MSYLSPKKRGECVRVVQKSKFLGIAASVETESDAQSFIADVRAENPTASAIAYAYTVDGNVQRFSDGGEPSGTAGMPILSVMQKKGLTRAICVVVRWFGGIKLGAGGLARAFSGTGADAIDNAGVALWCETMDYDVRVDYPDLGRIENRMAQYDFERLDTVFTDMVTLRLRVKAEETSMMLALFDEWTNANAYSEPVGEVYYYPWDREEGEE